MKRHGNIYPKIYDMANLILADKKARKGKKDQYGIKLFDKKRGCNLLQLQYELITKTYSISAYRVFKIFDPKEREIFRLPYRDRIIQHAIMNLLEPLFVSTFTKDTYSCIKGRGIHKCSFAIRRALRDEANTQYCLKFDIRKFYPNIDHAILKQLLRKKFKDNDLLWLLDHIIDSAPGVPIGNYLSQYFANFYLAYFDHMLKEVLKLRYPFRYADDVSILAATKKELHQVFHTIRACLREELKLEIKPNWRIFPITDTIPLDMVGYKHYRCHTGMRGGIKKNLCRAMNAKRINKQSVESLKGWAQHADTGNLLRKLAA